MKDIKSCPFCGRQAQLDGTADTIRIVCTCGATMRGETVSLHGYDKAVEITINKWNRRVTNGK